MSSNDSIYTGFEFDVDGFPAIAIINKDLADPAVQARYPHAVFVELEPDAYNEYGHPEQAEYDYLVEAEKKMIEYLESQTASVHVGHVTLYRMLQVIFYTSEPEKVEGFLGYYLSTVERTTNFEIESDAAWESVSAFYELL